MNPVLPVKIYVAHHPNGDAYGIACPDPAVVTQPNTLLRFEMQTQGYAFDEEEAIRVVDGEGNFIGSWTVSSNNATLVDVLVSEGTYEYWVWYRPVPPVPPTPPGGQPPVGSAQPPKLRLSFAFDPAIRNGSL